TNFNISVGITEKFMNAVKQEGEYELIDPHSKRPARAENAKRVFDMLVSAAWRNGDPGVVFLDRMNEDNPTPKLGEIESTNPCGEVPLLAFESCNLGSLNLAQFVKENDFDWTELREAVRIGVHFLDNVIDMNNYPLPEIEQMTKHGTRKIGLGVMGWAESLYMLDLPYNSEKAVQLADKLMGFIRKEADAKSIELAEKRGPFPAFEESTLNKPGAPKFRNATRCCIAPTGEISMIADTSGGIEPVFALSFVKRVLDGQDFLYLNDTFKKTAQERGFFSEQLAEEITNKGSIAHIESIPEDARKTFVVAFDIAPEWHVRMQAAFQKHVDLAVSKTINFPQDATIEDVEKTYMMAYDLGCKGITIYRDKSRQEQILNIEGAPKSTAPVQTVDPGLESPSQEVNTCPKCSTKLVMQEGCASCPSCGYSLCKV
ncbi:MAG: adenosylcobalamin-dependent ribonucleoside-diphosphate reductase, partial [Candidatus Diapherotrites archaeon]